MVNNANSAIQNCQCRNRTPASLPRRKCRHHLDPDRLSSLDGFVILWSSDSASTCAEITQQMTFKTSNFCYCYLFFRQLPQHQRSVMAAHRNDVAVVVKEPGARYGTAVYFFLVVFGFAAQTRVPDGKMSTNWRLTRLFLVTWIVWDIRQCRRLLINRGRLNDKRYWSVTW